MITIRPVTDLRYKFSEIENVVKEGEPVYLTKNGYGSMVLLSIEAFSRLSSYAESIESVLDETDRLAKDSSERLSHDEVFSKIRGKKRAK